MISTLKLRVGEIQRIRKANLRQPDQPNVRKQVEIEAAMHSSTSLRLFTLLMFAMASTEKIFETISRADPVTEPNALWVCSIDDDVAGFETLQNGTSYLFDRNDGPVDWGNVTLNPRRGADNRCFIAVLMSDGRPGRIY